VRENSALFAPCPPERRDAEVEEEHNHHDGDDKGPMIWAMLPTGAGVPHGGRKDDDRQHEEDAGDLKPEDAADAAEGVQKAADATGHAPRGFSGGVPGFAACGARIDMRIDMRICRRMSSLLRRRCRMRLAGKMPACDAPGYAESNAQGAPDGLRFHSVYDGSSGRRRSAFYTCRFGFAGCSQASVAVR